MRQRELYLILFRTCEFNSLADFEREIEQNVRGAILADVDSYSDPAGARSDKVHAITRYQGRIRRRGRQFETMLMNLFRTSIKHIDHDRKCISGKEMTMSFG